MGFQIGTRETKYFEKLSHKISHIDAKFYASDYWHAYNLIDPAKHLVGKSHTYTVERMNRACEKKSVKRRMKSLSMIE